MWSHTHMLAIHWWYNVCTYGLKIQSGIRAFMKENRKFCPNRVQGVSESVNSHSLQPTLVVRSLRPLPTETRHDNYLIFQPNTADAMKFTLWLKHLLEVRPLREHHGVLGGQNLPKMKGGEKNRKLNQRERFSCCVISDCNAYVPRS